MKRITDLTPYTNILPYASEIFGIYQPLIGWTSKRQAERMERGFATDLAKARRGLLQRLTPREREVLQQVALGRSIREIAALLDISPRTVEVYKSRLSEKLQARNTAELIRMALDAGISCPCAVRLRHRAYGCRRIGALRAAT